MEDFAMVAIETADRLPLVRPRATSPKISELMAWQIVGWPFATLVLTTILFWVGIPIGPYHLWIGLLLVLISGIAVDWRSWLTASTWSAIAILFGGAIVGWLYDFSGDGQWYQLPGILALAQGWNPFHVPLLADWNPRFEHSITSGLYVQHYAKGAWIVAAAAYRGTGLLEAAKVVNWLYMLAVYLLAQAFFSRLGMPRIWAHATALAAAANPVSLYQLPSFFVDGQLAALTALVILISVDYFRQPRVHALVMLSVCVVLLVDVKFTGVVYSVCLVGGVASLAYVSGRSAESMRYAATAVAAFVLAIILTGYQPYITNVIQHRNPFYPAVGQEDGHNVQWKNAPPQFMAMNRMEKLVRSTLAYSAGSETMPRWKLPFTVTKDELYIFFNTEPRYGGFGPFFGPILLLASGVFVLSRGVTPRRAWNLAACLGLVVFLSLLPNPEAWWARLAPQLWLVPVILTAVVAMSWAGWPRRIAKVLILLLLGNAMLVAALNWGRAGEKNLVFREQMRDLRAMSGAVPLEIRFPRDFQMATEHRLQENQIAFEPVDKLSCATPYRFSYPASAQSLACVPVLR